MSGNFHRAFQAVQHALHHIQADAASGDFGNLLGRTEPGLEDQFQNVAFAEPGRFFRADQFLLDRLGDDAPGVDAAPVVANLYNHLIAVVVGSETDGSDGRLAAARARFGGFNAMADSVPDQVRDRLGNRVQQALVEIGVLTADHEFDFFAALFGNVPHHARKPPKQLLDRHHPDFHHRALEIIQHAGLKRQGIGQTAACGFLRITPAKVVQGLLQHGFANDQLAHQIEHAVDALRIHPQNVFCDRAFGPDPGVHFFCRQLGQGHVGVGLGLRAMAGPGTLFLGVGLRGRALGGGQFF